MGRSDISHHRMQRSTISIIANAHLCDQVALLLGVVEKTARQVFLGEPAEVVLGMSGWILERTEREDFEPEAVLLARAEKRSRGEWRIEDRRVKRCHHCSGIRRLSGFPKGQGTGGGTRGVLCPYCRDSRITLKTSKMVSCGRDG